MPQALPSEAKPEDAQREHAPDRHGLERSETRSNQAPSEVNVQAQGESAAHGKTQRSEAKPAKLVGIEPRVQLELVDEIANDRLWEPGEWEQWERKILAKRGYHTRDGNFRAFTKNDVGFHDSQGRWVEYSFEDWAKWEHENIDADGFYIGDPSMIQ